MTIVKHVIYEILTRGWESPNSFCQLGNSRRRALIVLSNGQDFLDVLLDTTKTTEIPELFIDLIPRYFVDCAPTAEWRCWFGVKTTNTASQLLLAGRLLNVGNKNFTAASSPEVVEVTKFKCLILGITHILHPSTSQFLKRTNYEF